MKAMCHEQQSTKKQKICLQAYNKTSTKKMPLQGLFTDAERGGGSFGLNVACKGYFQSIYPNIIMNIQTYTVLTCIVVLVGGTYDIPSYYGHWSMRYFQVEFVQSGTFTYFQFHYNVDMDYDARYVYYANKQLHCIERYDLDEKRLKTIAGNCGVMGNQIGDFHTLKLNSPSSVAYYHPNQEAKVSEQQMKIYIVKNSSCTVTSSSCVMSEAQLQSAKLTMDNLRPYPEIILSPSIENKTQEYLYVSDTENHCIKRLDLIYLTSEVVAGECGESGFMDGPIGLNRLYRPTTLGINRLGILYFYDEGNQYFRKINAEGKVQTMLNGACKQFRESRTIGSYTLYTILCYDNWVELETAADIQHYLDQSTLDICLSHSSDCD